MESVNLEGINKTIYKWAEKSILVKSLGWFDENTKTFLAQALDDKVEKRYKSSIKLSKLIWLSFDQFGMYPDLDLLSEAEFGRVFYNKYRDHSTHVFKVYLLGLMIYEKNDSIRNKFFQQNIDDKRFAITWTITSLWHDIGYLYENEQVGKLTDCWNNIKERLNTQYESPISILSKIGLDSDKEIQFYKRNGIEDLMLHTVTSIENKEYFTILEPAGKITGLANSDTNTDSIRQLYDHIKSERTSDKRNPFKDHGIASALLLLHSWKFYKCKLKKTVAVWCDTPGKSLLGEEIEKKITSLYNKTVDAKATIDVAAKAIALHNLTASGWIEESVKAANEKGAYIKSFKISIDDDLADNSVQLFAFLLRLADEIQMWDRYGFDSPAKTETETIIYGKDMDILISKDSIGIWFEDDDNSYKRLEHSNTHYSILKRKLSVCLQADKLLKPLRTAQIPWHNEIAPEKEELVYLFYNNSAKELLTQIKDKYQCGEVRVLLYNRNKRTNKIFEYLQLNGNSNTVTDERIIEFAKENYYKQSSDLFPVDLNQKTAFAIISTYVGPIGFLVLENIPNSVCEELLSTQAHKSRLSDYGVMYGNLLIMKLRERVESENVFGGLKKADDFRKEINDYIPFGYNECISVFLDIRGLSKILSGNRIQKQRSLEFINGFSNSVQKISAQHYGIISTHFGGGMLITFNQVFREELTSSCFRATCAMYKIWESFKDIADDVFGKIKAKKIMEMVDIAIGASDGEVYFSTLGVNACVYYTGVGDKIGFAKKIENISGRDSVFVKELPLKEDDIISEDAVSSCKNKIFVSDTLYEQCKCVEGWADMRPVEAKVTYDNIEHKLYYLGKINQGDCPLPKDFKCMCCKNI